MGQRKRFPVRMHCGSQQITPLVKCAKDDPTYEFWTGGVIPASFIVDGILQQQR